MSTYQNLRDYVRSFLDVDSTDIPDALVDMWGAQAQNRIASEAVRWPFLEVQQTYNTVNATQTKTFASLTTPLRDVDSIIGPHWPIRQMEHQRAYQAFASSGTTTTGEPYVWSEIAQTIYFWPIPNAVYALTITGYKNPAPWLTGGASGTIDFPLDFHETIAAFMLAKAHMQQGDVEIGTVFENDFERQLESLKRRWLGNVAATPFVVNGGPTAFLPLPDRGRYPWE